MRTRENPVRLGLVGCGEVTLAKHLPALMAIPHISVVSLYDLDAARCKFVADKFGISRRCQSAAEMFADENVEAVGICVPPTAHAEVAIAAMQAGKHVWVDKPLAITTADCRRIIEEAERQRIVSMTGFHMRFHRLVTEARQALLAGCVGPVQSVRVVWHSPRGDKNCPEWKTSRGSGGGALIEIAVHQFDLLRFLLQSEIEEIFALGRDGVRDDEEAVISARMANGVLVTGEFSERSPHAIEIEVSGRDGLLHLNCLQFDGLELRGAREVPGDPKFRLKGVSRFFRTLPTGLRVMRRGGDYRESYRYAWEAFAQAIRSGQPPDATLHDGLRAVEAVSAAVQSRVSGLRVQVPAPDAAAASTPSGSPSSSHAPAAATPVARDANPSSSLKFSVVVPTYERPEHVRGLLAALRAQDLGRDHFEVILVDDGAATPLEPQVSSYRDLLDLKVLRQQNAGCAPARQRGIDAARGEFLVFTDDDCRPVPRWLSRLSELLEAHPSCGVAGPTINGLADNLFAEATQIVVGFVSCWDIDPAGFIQYAPTSNLALPAAAFQAIGGLNKTWHMAGGEDRDLCARWHRAGFRIFHSSSAQVYHYHRLTLRQFCRQHFNYGRGALMFHRRSASTRQRTNAYPRAGFYFALVAEPLRRSPWPRAAALAALVLFTQACTVAGSCYEFFFRTRVTERATLPLDDAPADSSSHQGI